MTSRKQVLSSRSTPSPAPSSPRSPRPRRAQRLARRPHACSRSGARRAACLPRLGASRGRRRGGSCYFPPPPLLLLPLRCCWYCCCRCRCCPCSSPLLLHSKRARSAFSERGTGAAPSPSPRPPSPKRERAPWRAALAPGAKSQTRRLAAAALALFAHRSQSPERQLRVETVRPGPSRGRISLRAGSPGGRLGEATRKKKKRSKRERIEPSFAAAVACFCCCCCRDLARKWNSEGSSAAYRRACGGNRSNPKKVRCRQRQVKMKKIEENQEKNLLAPLSVSFSPHSLTWFFDIPLAPLRRATPVSFRSNPI